jgi:hypothetical protein
MGIFTASAVTTATFFTGALFGLLAGGSVVACACRKACKAETREHSEKPGPEPQKG